MRLAVAILPIIFFCGCAHVLEPFVESLIAGLSPNTASGEIYSGAVGFYAWHNRWPRTKEELEAGLKCTRKEVRFISSLPDLTLTEENNRLHVSYSTTEGSSVQMQFERPEKKQVSAASENQNPTPASMRSASDHLKH